jgi:heat shock protein HslJ
MCQVPAVEPVHHLYEHFRDDGGKNLPWASSAVTARLTSVNEELQLTVTTACAPMNGQATVHGNTLNVRNIAVGAVGCTEDDGEQQLWVLDFLKRPIQMTFDDGILTWTSGTDSLTFRGK